MRPLFKKGDEITTDWNHLAGCVILVTNSQTYSGQDIEGHVISYPPDHHKAGSEPAATSRFTNPDRYRLYDPYDDLLTALDHLEHG